MKRNITAIFLVIAIMFGNMFIFSVSAADGIAIQIGVGSNIYEYKEGTIFVPVTISGNTSTGITGYVLNIKYDSEVLEYKGAVEGDVEFELLDITTKEKVTDDNIRAVGAQVGIKDGDNYVVNNPVTGNGVLFTLEFKVIGDSTTTEITLNGDSKNSIEYGVKNYIDVENVAPCEVVVMADNSSVVRIDKKIATASATSVSVFMDKEIDIIGYMLEITFDPDDLEFIPSEPQYVDGRFASAALKVGTTDTIKVIGMNYDTSGSGDGAPKETVVGKLLDLNFNVLVENKEIPLTITVANAIDSNEVNPPLIDLYKENGWVKLVKTLPTGDLIKLKDETQSNYWFQNKYTEGRALVVPYDAEVADVYSALNFATGYTLKINSGETGTALEATATDKVSTGTTFGLYTGTTLEEEIVVLKYGDVDGNGVANTDDITEIYRKIGNENYGLSKIQLLAADIDDMNDYNTDDITEIYRKIGNSSYQLGPVKK